MIVDLAWTNGCYANTQFSKFAKVVIDESCKNCTSTLVKITNQYAVGSIKSNPLQSRKFGVESTLHSWAKFCCWKQSGASNELEVGQASEDI